MTSPDQPVEYLTLADLLDLARALDVGPVCDIGLVEIAAHRPQAGFMGQEAYPSITEKAAALMHSACSNHALVDGNTWLAFLATAVFLRINGYNLALSDDDAFELTMAVEAGQFTADDIAVRLHFTPPRNPDTNPPGTQHATTGSAELSAFRNPFSARMFPARFRPI